MGIVENLREICKRLPIDIQKEIESCFTYKVFEKNEHLLKIGNIENNSYILISGTVRYYTINDKTEERNLYFFSDNDYFTAFESYFKKSASAIGLQTISESKILIMHKEKFDFLSDKYHVVEKIRSKILEQFILKSTSIHQDLLSLNSKEKYKKLLAENPQIIKEIPIKHLATYLGIHPNSLSRIRKEIVTEIQ